jgi:hypothetical protein
MSDSVRDGLGPITHVLEATSRTVRERVMGEWLAACSLCSGSGSHERCGGRTSAAIGVRRRRAPSGAVVRRRRY